MSTKKTAAAAVCAGCEKRDATIKRQAEAMEIWERTAQKWFAKWLCLSRTGHAERAQEVDAFTAQRDTLQSRIDSFIKTCADIRAVCVDAGIEHADKMATLTAVKALSENAKRCEVSWREADHALRTRPTCEMLTSLLRDYGIHCERTEHSWKVRGLRRKDRWYIAIPRITVHPADRAVFYIALFTAIGSFGVVIAALFA